MSQEALLREAIEAMTTGVRGMDGIAATAIARGRRIRRRQRLIAAAAVVLLAATGATVLYQGMPTSVPTNIAAGVPSPGRTLSEPGARILADWALVPGPAVQEFPQPDLRVLRADGGDSVSPTGRFVMRATAGSDGFRLSILRDGKEVHNVALPGAEAFQWSPVSDTVLTTLSNVEGQKGFATINAETGQVQSHLPVSIPASFCGPCSFSWYPRGNEVVVRQAEDFTDADGNFTGRGSTFLFDAVTGKATRNLPLQVNVSGPGSWSPNGRYALSETERGSQLIDLELRQMTQQLPGRAWFANDETLLVIRSTPERGRELLVMKLDGTITEVITLAGAFTKGNLPVLVIRQ